MKKLRQKMIILGPSISNIIQNAYFIAVKLKIKLKNLLLKTFSQLDLPDNRFTDEDTFAYHILGDRVVQISPVKNPGNSNTLPEELIVKPGVYNFNSHVYDLSNEGLYRFLSPCK